MDTCGCTGWLKQELLLNVSMITVFVEQPLAFPMSAKNALGESQKLINNVFWGLRDWGTGRMVNLGSGEKGN